MIHLAALLLYTKLVEIFVPMGPPWYIIIKCQRILANYSLSKDIGKLVLFLILFL